MKYKIGFKLNIVEMIILLVTTFFAGMIIMSAIDHYLIIFGLLFISIISILWRKRVKILLKQDK